MKIRNKAIYRLHRLHRRSKGIYKTIRTVNLIRPENESKNYCEVSRKKTHREYLCKLDTCQSCSNFLGSQCPKYLSNLLFIFNYNYLVICGCCMLYKFATTESAWTQPLPYLMILAYFHAVFASKTHYPR